MFQLVNPWALLGLISLPILTALYFLRNRHRKIKVSSIIFWQTLQKPKQGGRSIKNPRFPLLFLLELLILILLTAAGTRILYLSRSQRKPIMIILDNSYSMSAKDLKGKSAKEKGIIYIKKIIKDYNFDPYFMLAGDSPNFIDNSDNFPNFKELNKLWQCKSKYSCLKRALTEAKKIANENSYFLVITDKAPKMNLKKNKVIWKALGYKNSNIGFINAVRKTIDNKDQCLWELKNFSDIPGQTTVSIECVEKILKEKKYNFKPNETIKFRYSFPEIEIPIYCKISDDSLNYDNESRLLTHKIKKVPIKISISNKKLNKIIYSVLKSTNIIFHSEKPKIVFTDSPEIKANEDFWVVQIIQSKNPRAFSGPFIKNSVHPINEGIDLRGTIWGAGKEVLKGIPLVTVGNTTLAADKEINNSHHITIKYNPEYSNIQKSFNFPILFWNIFNWRNNENIGILNRNLRLGSNIYLKLPKRTTEIKLTTPDGTIKKISINTNSLIYPANTQGIYSFTKKEQSWSAAVNVLSENESDLSNSLSGEWGKWINENNISEQSFKSASGKFIMIIILLLLIHQFLISKSSLHIPKQHANEKK
ncbi:MAG: BatA domain-containing protein [Verrucomicrobiota bacterium]|nr:BatA domain-containing protein [Verrucomicrobiota bacterium]